MNLIERIAHHIAAGLSAAEVSARLEIEHAVKVGEDWVRKIMSADGFAAALASAQAQSAEVSAAAQEEVGDAVDGATEAVESVAEKVEADISAVEGVKQPLAPASNKESAND